MASRRGRRPSKPPAEMLQPEAWARAGMPAQWAELPPEQIAAAHRRAAQLIAGGWGAVQWPEGPGQPAQPQLL